MANGLFNLKQVMQAVQQSAWVAQKPPAVEYLVVAGGGGGGAESGGGGGAGGLLQGIDPVPNGQTLLVTVGAAGTGRPHSTPPYYGGDGGNSVFGSIIAAGGGGGGKDGGGTPTVAPSGGSGGGGGMRLGFGGGGLAGQGNAGGSCNSDSVYAAAGGGGAGTPGLDRVNGSSTGTTGPGVGGVGVASAISGTVTTYAGGGGGGVYVGTGQFGPALGGPGGGGTGGQTPSTGLATAGTVNTGGGGGGGGSSTASAYSSGANGGSGIVIVSYPDVYAAATSTTGSPTVSTSGSGSISFNGSNQYLSTSATQVIPATGDFTIEAWIYPTSFSGSPVFCGQGSAGDPGRTLFYISTGGVPTFTNGSSFTFSSSGTVSLNTWTYIAFTRSGSTGTWYINGASAGTGSLSGITIQNTFITIGGSNPLWTAQYFTGYISNFRISTVARTITSTPTVPFDPNTTNTKMLLSTASGAFLADASTNAYTFTNNGTSTWNQLSPFATGSGYKNRVYTWTTSGSITF